MSETPSPSLENPPLSRDGHLMFTFKHFGAFEKALQYSNKHTILE